MFVTDTLGDPFTEVETLGSWYGKIAESRRQANQIKRKEPITVVIGNPPYKEKAKGKGSWIEQGSGNVAAPLNDWQPPKKWGVGAHAKHLRNLYIYFWRWAAWKVFREWPRQGRAVGDRLLHHRRRVPERSRVPEDARAASARV
jgi:predicted helicase